jgi:hypothetical protein
MRILCLVFVLSAAVNVFAQEKTIRQAEFETIAQSSSRLLAGNPRRIIRTQQSSVEIMPQANEASKKAPASVVSIKSTTEFVPTVGYRSVYEFNSSSQNIKKEIIRIGEKTYVREDSGQWTETAALNAPKRRMTAKNSVNQIEYKVVGSEKLNNQNTNIYAKIEKSKFVDPTDNRENVSDTITKYWYAEDGRLIKRERTREIRSGRMISKFNSTTVFEIDPNIKIEAPKLN